MPKAHSNSLPADRDQLLVTLKNFAKSNKAQDPTQSLASHLDAIAKTFHFQNWSLLHKNVTQMSAPQFSAFAWAVQVHPGVLAFLQAHATELPEDIDEDVSKDEMREWVRATYTPLVDFAPLDSESENGFAFRDEDLLNDLQEEFDQRFPYEWIEEVAGEMEMEGPWGIDRDFGNEEGDPDHEPPEDETKEPAGEIMPDGNTEVERSSDEWSDFL